MKTFTWISVKDALPEPEERVLVLPEPTGENDSVCWGFLKGGELAWIRDYGDDYSGYRSEHYHEITHWMYDPRDYHPKKTSDNIPFPVWKIHAMVAALAAVIAQNNDGLSENLLQTGLLVEEDGQWVMVDWLREMMPNE